jgi:hypothetical protein
MKVSNQNIPYGNDEVPIKAQSANGKLLIILFILVAYFPFLIYIQPTWNLT